MNPENRRTPLDARGRGSGRTEYDLYHLTLDPQEFDTLLGIGQESFCRYLWSPRYKENAWQAVGKRESGKPTTTVELFQEQAEGQLTQQDISSLPLDVYISPNQFFEWRNTKQLASLHANWIEIDTKEHRTLAPGQEQEIVSEALRQLKEKGMPLPTAYVLSGSGGVHLYWIYEGVEAYKWRVESWRSITSRLAKALSGGKLWEVDLSASRDPARVLRKVGTYHGKSKRLVAAFTGGETYSFAQLAGALGVPHERPTYLSVVSTSPQKPTFQVNSPTGVIVQKPTVSIQPGEAQLPGSRNTADDAAVAPGSGKHTMGQWWAKVYFHVLHCLRGRGVQIGQRDSAAFILFNALRHLKGEEEAFETIKTLNDELIRLDPEELESYLSTAKKVRYKYKKDTLADYLEKQLGIKAEFLYKDTPAPLPAEEIKRRQHIAAHVTAHARSRKTFTRLLDAMKSLLETRMTVTQEAVALMAGRSERTVRRYWSSLVGVLDNSSPSIYSPQGGFVR